MKLFIVAFITSYFTILLVAIDPISILSCLLREVLLVVNKRGSFYQLTAEEMRLNSIWWIQHPALHLNVNYLLFPDPDIVVRITRQHTLVNK